MHELLIGRQGETLFDLCQIKESVIFATHQPGDPLCWLLSISVPHSSAHESCLGAFSLPSTYERGGMKGSCLTIFFLILERIC
jgi:hypothetical protein